MTIALLTDFGNRDYYVGAMKGVILSLSPESVVVDITHEIEPQNIASAAFVLKSCFLDFPSGTVFVCVVDPGVGSARRGIVASGRERFFVGPDNGIFSLVLDGPFSAHELTNEAFHRTPVSSTFHGRDIFAPAAAHLNKGVRPEEFGPAVVDPVILSEIFPKRTPGGMEGIVLHIDHFGNIVTNVTAADVTSPFELEIGSAVITVRRDHYSGATPGRPFAYAGSSGLLEIAIDHGSAAEELGVRAGESVSIRL